MRSNFSSALNVLLHSKFVVVISVIGSLCLVVSGSYLSFTATRGIQKANETSLELDRQLSDMTLPVDLKSVAVNGWYAPELSNTQRLVNHISYIANALDAPALMPPFVRDAQQWADASHTLLRQDLDKVRAFTLADPSSLDLQRTVIGVYESQIQLVDLMADLVRHWQAESSAQRRDRLADWHRAWVTFNQHYARYTTANERQTTAIHLKSRNFVQQSQVASAQLGAIHNQVKLSGVNAITGFTILWILLGLRLTHSPRLVKQKAALVLVQRPDQRS